MQNMISYLSVAFACLCWAGRATGDVSIHINGASGKEGIYPIAAIKSVALDNGLAR